MNKYYKPDISEFHIGFEYQEKQQGEDGYLNDDWATFVVEEDWKIPAFITGIKSGDIKVKYLDKDDIEELRWVDIGDDFYSFKNSANYILYYNASEHFIEIQDHLEGMTIFNGIIKNKSELKRLMKMLEI